MPEEVDPPPVREILTGLGRCRACDAPILWCETNAGKSIPVDAELASEDEVLRYFAETGINLPFWSGRAKIAEDGNLRLSTKFVGLRRTIRATVDPEPDLLDPDRYLSHFVTCPEADSFRRTR